MTRQAIKYKVLLDKIFRKMKADGVEINRGELDAFVKSSAGVEGSSKTMPQEDLNILIEQCYLIAEQIGLNNEEDKLC